MEDFFIYDERLGIPIPHLKLDFAIYPPIVQKAILKRWEQIRGKIPERIQDIEGIINHKLNQLNDEDDFEVSCTLNYEIAEHASIINDLWIWYRTEQDLTGKKHL